MMQLLLKHGLCDISLRLIANSDHCCTDTESQLGYWNIVQYKQTNKQITVTNVTCNGENTHTTHNTRILYANGQRYCGCVMHTSIRL